MVIADEPDIITQDYFFKRKVSVLQYKKGYRFSIDAPLLADFLPDAPTSTTLEAPGLTGHSALEVGTGSGIVSLLALFKKKFSSITALEIQPRLARLAEMNAENNGFARKMTVITGDFNQCAYDFAGVTHIYSNPPYYELNRGRLSPNPEIRDAKSETRLSVKQLISGSYNILGKNGCLYLVLPCDRYQETHELARSVGFYVGRSREVFSFKDGKAERFLVQLCNYRVAAEKMPPLVIFKDKGVYTDEMDAILTG